MTIDMHSNFAITAAALAVMLLTSPGPASAYDALAGATPQLHAVFSPPSVIRGPNVVQKSVLPVGTELVMRIQVGNPWTDNQVTMNLVDSKPGMSLIQVSTQQSLPVWEFRWTPTPDQVGTTTVNFQSTFYQSTGTWNYTAALVPIKVSASGGSVSQVTGIKLTAARWNKKKQLFSVNGNILYSPAKGTVPEGTGITLTYADGTLIPGPLSADTQIMAKGAFKIQLPLSEADVPCALMAEVTSSGKIMGTTPVKSVTPKLPSCR